MATSHASPDTAVPAKRPNPLMSGSSRKALLVAGLTVAGLVLVYLVGDRPPALVTQYLVSGLLLGGVYALVSLGLTLIFGVLGIVNFAQGAMLTLAMYLVYVLQGNLGINLYVAVVLTIPLLFGFGWLVQSMLLNRLTEDVSHERPLLVTLGLSLLIMNVLLMIFGGRPKSVDAGISGNIQILGAQADIQRIIAFAGAMVVAAALTLVLRRTSMGLAIRAVAANGTGAALVGVNVRRIYALTFGLGAASVAVAGGLITPFTTLVPSAGEQFTTLAFVIVVLGGLGSIPGALVGGLFIGILQTVGSLYLPGSGSLILVFGIFVLILFLRPQGLFGAKQ